MLKKIPFKISINIILTTLFLVTIFHLLVLFQIIPFNIVWGGRLKNTSEMVNFETISLLINSFIIFVVLIKGTYIKPFIPFKIINIILWFLVFIFSANTIGNLLAKTSTETIVFTPLTFILAILCSRLALEKV